MEINIDKLNEALIASWCRETAYRTDQPFWSEKNKARGQCTVTTMVIHDYLGGQILRGFSKKYNIYHYWNIINNEKIDLTFEQFLNDKDDILFDIVVSKTHEDLMKIGNVRRRYLLLKSKVEKYIKDNYHFND